MANDQLDASIVQSARANAPDFYLTGLLAKRTRQRDLVVLAALVGELATIPARVSEPMIGHIRLQWWGDWLTNRETSGNAIADAATTLLEKHPAVTEDLRAMVEAQHGAIDALFAGAGHDHQRETGRFYAAAFSAASGLLHEQQKPGTDGPGTAPEVVKPAGFAYGTASTLLLLRSYAKLGVWPFPATPSSENEPDTQFKTAIPSNLVSDKKLARERRASVEAAITAARARIQTVSTQYHAQTRNTAHALLPIALVEPYFRSFEITTEDPLMTEAGISPFKRHWTLLRAWWKLRAR